MEIIGLIIAGLIIGLLGKFVAPGARDNTPLWLTLLCGIGGVLIGYYVSGALGVAATPGIDFDPIRGNRTVRFSFAGATADMVEAVRRLVAWEHAH